MRFKALLVFISLLFSTSAFSYPINWKSLDQYVGTRSKAEILSDLRILLQRESAEVTAHFNQHIQFERNSIQVISETGAVEYEFPFEDKKDSTPRVRGAKPLDGYKIAIDGNNMGHVDPSYFDQTQKISSLLAQKLEKEGATVLITQPRIPMTVGEYAKIVDEIFAFEPDMALAIRFKSGGLEQPDDTFVSFCPGCFTKGELAAERFRYRFMHALVSGKLWESAKLAAHIAAKVQGLKSNVKLLTNERTFGQNACGIPLDAPIAETVETLGLKAEGSAFVPGVLGRNLFFNAVPALVNVWINPGHDFTSQDPETIAETYFQGILSYLK